MRGSRAGVIDLDTVEWDVEYSRPFRNGTSDSYIEEFKQLVMTDANRDRLICCIISKLLT